MEYIQDQVFYHVQAIKTYNPYAPWQIGDTRFIGDSKNPFFGYYDKNTHTVINTKNSKIYNLSLISKAMVEYVKNNSLDPELATFYHCNPAYTMIELDSCLSHYTTMVRELIFEEVREKSFPQLPSRQKGLWVIANDNFTGETVQFWWDSVGESQNKRILKLQLTGKLHKCNNKFLASGTLSLDTVRQNAFRYWTGSEITDTPTQNECIFEGFAQVMDIVDLTHFTCAQ